MRVLSARVDMHPRHPIDGCHESVCCETPKKQKVIQETGEGPQGPSLIR